MSNSRYYLFGALSGCTWGGIAYVLGHQWMGSIIWGGILASPLIGMIIALTCRRAYKLPVLARVFLALVTLYLAAALFGLGVGAYDAARDIPNRMPGAVVVQSVLATLWGVTLTGFVLFLWPLSYLNHWLLGRVEPVGSKNSADR